MQFNHGPKPAQPQIERLRAGPLPLPPSIGNRGPIAPIVGEINWPHDALVEIGRNGLVLHYCQFLEETVVAVHLRVKGAGALVVADHRVIRQDLAAGASELTVLIMDEVIIGTGALQLPASPEPAEPRRTRRVEVRPRLSVAVDAGGIGEIGRAGLVGGEVVTLEHAHAPAEGKAGVIVLVIFEDDVIEETFGVEGLLSTDHVEHCVFLDEREGLACESRGEHAHRIAALAVPNRGGRVARRAVGSRIPRKVRIPDVDSILIVLVRVPQSDTPFAIRKEHVLVDQRGLVAGRVRHEADLTRVADQPRCADTALPGKAVNHERNDAATCSIVREPIVVQVLAGGKREDEALSHAPLGHIAPHRYSAIRVVDLGELLVTCDIIDHHGAGQIELFPNSGLSEQVPGEIVVVDLEDQHQELPGPEEDVIVEANVIGGIDIDANTHAAVER